MTRLAQRARTGAHHIADTDLSKLRSRVLDIVDDAMGQVEHVLKEAPSRKEARVAAAHTADKVRTSHAVESAVGLVVAGAPAVARFARSHMSRRNARHATKVLPAVVRAHPVLLGAAVAASAIVGVELLRRRRASDNERRLTGAGASGFDLDEEVARMEGEGGDPGAYDGEPPNLRGRARAGIGNGSGTR